MRRKNRRVSGFSLIEVMFAITILAIGLLGLAGLLATLTGTTTNSRYGGVQALLASEKLEDLSRRPSVDPAIAAPGGSAGSLTGDTAQSVTVGAVTENVAYFDDVQISSGNGGVTETVSTGASSYIVTTHAPTGAASSTAQSTAPAATKDTLTFHRRWIIEQNVPVTGVRRITVIVNLTDGTRAVPFQMSTVRP
jgi:type IV pilus assembly protein PilV